MRTSRQGCRRSALTALAAGALLVLLICPLGSLAIRQGYVAPPTFHRDLGIVQLHAVVTLDPQCPMTFCGTQRINSSLQQYYVAWIEVIQNEAGNVRVTGYRLIELPLRR